MMVLYLLNMHYWMRYLFLGGDLWLFHVGLLLFSGGLGWCSLAFRDGCLGFTLGD